MLYAFTIGLTMLMLAGEATFAQFVPPPPALQNRIPAPLGAPEQPPVIYGPLGQSSPSPRVYNPGRLNTRSQRTTRCYHQGAGYGLKGAKLNRYVRSCANS